MDKISKGKFVRNMKELKVKEVKSFECSLVYRSYRVQGPVSITVPNEETVLY